MNDEAARQSRSATTTTVDSSTGAGRRPPALQFVVELEELPAWRVIADCHEDELRLRRWLRNPAVRRRFLDALLDGLDDLAA